MLARLSRYALRHKKALALSVTASLVSATSGMLAPLAARKAVDSLTKLDLGSVGMYAALFVALAVVRGVSAFVQSVKSREVAEYVAFDLRVELYRKLRELPLLYLYRKGAGRLVARATGDVEQVKFFFRFALSSTVAGLALLALSAAAMLSMSFELTLLTLAALSPMPLVIRKFARLVRSHFEAARKDYASMTTVLREALVSMVPIRAVGAERFVASKFGGFNESYASHMVTVGKLRGAVWPTLSLLTNLAVLAVLWYGGLKVAAGELTVGDVVAFTMYVNALSWPVTALGILTVLAERARVAASRVFEILEAEGEVYEKPGAKPLRVERGEVVFEDVWFTYDGSKWVLRGLNLRVRPGEIVAVTGGPGSGKSTLAMLLLRLVDPQRGRVLIDGQDIREVSLESLRRQVTLVHQDIYLFPDTIKNNIAYAKPGASLEEVVRAAKVARIHDFIESLPRGYDTVVGERGVTLSGGQRQRIALARALLADPKVIVLDDTTSEVDAETEAAIYEALTRHLRGKTIIVITQRPSVMAVADRVVVLEGGKVARVIKRKRAEGAAWRGA